jgi:ribonuclease P/MRP protein subunit POP8
VDVLKLEGSEVWIRVPVEDRSAVVAAVGGWVGRGGEGWKVVGWSSWSAGAESGKAGGRELFGN